jgi:endonuclease/exonuclease/phosphatase family metal-dependent hydrolase
MQGLDLPSEGNQAAVMHVTLDPDRLVADPEAAGYLHIYNAWLGFREAQRNGLPVPEGEQDQNRQLDQMLGWIAGEHGPAWNDRIVMGGTFNFPPDSPLYRALTNNSVFKDPFAGLRIEDSMTVYLVDGTTSRYDYLFTAKLPLNSAGIDHSAEAANTSDHRSAIVAVSRRQGVQCTP